MKQRGLLVIACSALIASCATDQIGGPDALAAPSVPAHILRAIEASGVSDGPLAVFEGIDQTNRRFAVASHVPSGGTTGFASLAASQELPLLFSVHPSGGTRDNLSPKSVGGVEPSTSGGFFFVCIFNGNVLPVLQAHVDSIYQSNFSTPSGGHSPGHDYSNTSSGRPLGKYMPRDGDTDANGRFGTTYTPNIASGDEMVTLDWVTTDPSSPCVGIPKTEQYRAVVRVPNLSPLQATADIELSPPTSHDVAGFWFLTDGTIAVANEMATLYREEYAQSMRLTAASLILGGINDISRNWSPSPLGHFEHRIGTDIDVDDKPNNNDQDVLRDMVQLGERAGFAKCQVDNMNHVHCRQRLY